MSKTTILGSAAALVAVAGAALAQPPGITMALINTTLPLEGAPRALPGPYQVTTGAASGAPGAAVSAHEGMGALRPSGGSWGLGGQIQAGPHF